jgi:hypothetical protein
LDLWGSYLPLNAQLYDVQLARTAAYTKVKDVRRQISVIIQSRKGRTYGNIMRNLLK